MIGIFVGKIMNNNGDTFVLKSLQTPILIIFEKIGETLLLTAHCSD